MLNSYDIIVVGAGHAGCEAASAAAKMGSSVLLVTLNLQTIAHMSCNPAMGGIAKGQIVREIDALGGSSGIVADKSMIQFRMLNLSKGPAMWSPRSQNDRQLFSAEWKSLLENNDNIDLWQDMVQEILIKKGKCVGVKTAMGQDIKAKAVILTNGTFLNGLIHIGTMNFGGGRMGESSVTGLTEQLCSLGFDSGRMKTGTPPRVDGRSLNYSKMEEQKGDSPPSKFSFSETKALKKQKSCFIAYTNPQVHSILKKGFEQSPLFTGTIKGTGPRYCPSIEDKIERFAQRDRHQLFVEPEGWNTTEMYINGFSTSLPYLIQLKALRKIEGFENVKITRPGYAIEYDYFPPTQLELTLETKLLNNLFFAGQINGTTGYEEAAAQGLLAGINAHNKLQKKPLTIIKRSEAYIGVLIDDLINKGTDEPYRMFTSRAEFRTLLRHDNGDQRLTPLAYKLGMVDKTTLNKVKDKTKAISDIIKHYGLISITPKEINNILVANGTSPLEQKTKLSKLLTRPQLNISHLLKKHPRIKKVLSKYEISHLEEAEIQLKYKGYIEKEQELAAKMTRLDEVKILDTINYNKMSSLSSEAIEKLSKVRPKTIGQATRISGVSPADVSIIMIYLGR